MFEEAKPIWKESTQQIFKITFKKRPKKLRKHWKM